MELQFEVELGIVIGGGVEGLMESLGKEEGEGKEQEGKGKEREGWWVEGVECEFFFAVFLGGVVEVWGLGEDG